MPSSVVGRDDGRTPLTARAARGIANAISLLATDILAGGIVAAINIALAVSFAALLFQGELRDGFAMGLWSLLMGMVVTGVLVNLMTSIPPISAGPDTPVVAVMTLLAAALSSQVLALGGSADLAVKHTLLAFSIMSLLAGCVMFLIGVLEWGQLLRLVPYPVVAGFLAATGWLLVISSYKVITGEPLTVANVAGVLAPLTLPKIAVTVVFASGVLVARDRIKAPYFLPLVFFGAAGALDLALWGFAPEARGWHIGGINNLEPWVPIVTAMAVDIDWSTLVRVLPETATCVIVGIISLLVKISAIETGRSAAADFNREFRANGVASLIAAPLGAMAGSVLVGSSKAFVDAGARTRLSGLAAAAIIGLVVLAGVDLPRFVPTPILAGFLLLLGYSMLTDALKGAFNQRSWLEFVLALAIALICLCFGYIAGVIAGFVCSCLIFAFSYSRIGVVRRHLTRASFAGDVERAAETERLLRKKGDAIHVYWLSGYVFFGSSEGLFERVRMDSEATGSARYIVLDFAGVAGMDSSAMVSMVKLRNFCDKRGVTLVYAGFGASLQRAFERAGLLGSRLRHRAFANLNEALEWCEEQLLATVDPAGHEASASPFEQWLARELGVRPCLGGYFERRECTDGDVLYRQGDPADTIDLIASGTLAISLGDGQGASRRIRRSARQTVLGEMGFFRGARRAATISSQGPTVIYTLSRASLDRMQRERSDLYDAFLRFVIRTLSDRLEQAHKEVSALA